MRCPKCSYISYDHLETCKKCGKKIQEASEQIAGTVYDAAPPLFLHFAKISTDSNGLEDTFEDDAEGAFGEEELDFGDFTDAGEGESAEEETLDLEEFELDLDDDMLTLDEAEEAEAEEASDSFSLDLDSEDTVENEADVSAGFVEEATSEPAGPPVDFGDMDISDLAPPAREKTPAVQAAEGPLSLEDVEEPVAAMAPPVSSAAGLEDLQLDDIDLDYVKPATRVAAGKIVPSVKTGTVLDDFDIDLREILKEEES